MGNSVPLLLVNNGDTSGLPCLPSSQPISVYEYNPMTNSWVFTHSAAVSDITMQGNTSEWSALDVISLPPAFGGVEPQLGIQSNSDCWLSHEPRGAAKSVAGSWTGYKEVIEGCNGSPDIRGPSMQTHKIAYFSSPTENAIYFGGNTSVCESPGRASGPLIRLVLGQPRMEQVSSLESPAGNGEVYSMQLWGGSESGCGDNPPLLWVGGTNISPVQALPSIPE